MVKFIALSSIYQKWARPMGIGNGLFAWFLNQVSCNLHSKVERGGLTGGFHAGAARAIFPFMKILVILSMFWSLAAQEPVASAIPVEDLRLAQDQAIQERLIKIFSAIDDLSDVSVEVTEGVATLSGATASSNVREKALKLAQEMDGVVYVQNKIEEEVEVAARLAPAQEKALNLWKATLRRLPLILVAIFCVAVAWVIGSWVGNRESWLKKWGLNELSASLAGRLLKLAIIGLGLFVAMELLDVTAIATGILGVAGVAGVALGFAFRNIVENYLAGILLSMRHPFSTGDAVKLGEHTGKVIRLTSRDTVLMTFDGNHLRIPNSIIMTSAMTNYTRNPLRRFDFAIGVSTDLDLVEVQELGLRTLDDLSAVLADPAPHILIDSLGDSTVNMMFHGWVDQRNHDFLKSKSESIRLIKTAFDNAGIEMPEPIYRVHLREAKAAAPAPVMRELEEAAEGDLSVDSTIDRQVATVQANDGETNLLEESPKEKS